MRRLAALSSLALALLAPGCSTYHTFPGSDALLPPTSGAVDSIFSLRERQLGDLLTHDHGQTRTKLVWNPILARVARERAWDMARRNYFSHVNPDGLGANTLVERAGYVLPANYD